MSKKCLYIGENKYVIQKLKKNFHHIKFTPSDYPLQALRYIQNDPDFDVVIFEAVNSLKISGAYIRSLKENISDNIVFIALTEKKAYSKTLFLAGADDVFPIELNTESLLKRITFLANYKKLDIRINGTEKSEYAINIPAWKRFVDITLSGIAILLLLPFFILIALAIRIESKGKVFYASKRVGKGYKIFDFYKFRSMYINADQKVDQLTSRNQYSQNDSINKQPVNNSTNISGDSVLFDEEEMVLEIDYLEKRNAEKENAFYKIANDPRITKVGRIIRNISIDELPQLFNILKGDMSVVGNRPLPLYEAEMLTSDQWAVRFLGPAGLTGLWQVTKRGGANKMSSAERKQLDIDYINNLSFWNDFKIILKTVPAMIQHENV